MLKWEEGHQCKGQETPFLVRHIRMTVKSQKLIMRPSFTEEPDLVNKRSLRSSPFTQESDQDAPMIYCLAYV